MQWRSHGNMFAVKTPFV